MNHVIFLDGKYVNVSKPLMDAFTPGAFQAKGVFETMLVLDGVVLDIDQHFKRLRQGLKVLGIKPPAISPLIVKRVVSTNQGSCLRLRVMVWQDGKQVHLMVMALPYQNSDKESYRVCLIKTDRPAHDRWCNVKSLDYGLFADAFLQAQSQGFDEALLLNKRGHIFEASRANIFWIKDGQLYTPPLSSGCLNGITRQQVIKQARSLKIRVQEKNLTPQTLKKADTAFLSNSLIGIKPITF